MDRYIGLDAHTQSSTLVVLNAAGKRVQTQVVETNGQSLIGFVKSVAGRRHLCIEEGLQSSWLHDLLERHVEELVIVASQARKHGPKTDFLDAQALAEMLRIGSASKRVYKPSGQVRVLRSAARSYSMIVEDVVRVKNRLKAMFNARGLTGTGTALYDPQRRESWLRKMPDGNRQLATMQAKELDALEVLRSESEAWLKSESRNHRAVKLLMTVPGIGEIRAAQVVGVVGTPHRFRTIRQFRTYCGLAVVTSTSSEWEQGNKRLVRVPVQRTRGLNRNRNPILKSVFKSAALSVIQQLPGHPLSESYHRALANGMKPNLARLTLARRIAAAALAVWKKEEAYDPQRAMPMTA